MVELQSKSVDYCKLEEKRRLLRQKLQEAEKELEQKQEYADRLRKELVDLNLGRLPEAEREPKYTAERLCRFIKDLCIVFQKVMEEGQYLPTKYATRTATLYYKVEKEVLDQYICEFTSLPLMEFLDFCSWLSVLKSEGGKIVFTSGRKRVYFLNRKIVDRVRGVN